MLTTRRPSPAAAVARAGLSLLVIALIFRLLLGTVDFAKVWDSMRDVGPLALTALVLAMVASEIFKSLIPNAIIDNLGLAQSFVADQTSGVMSKALPGPSGTAARFAIYRSFGITGEQFTTSMVVNSLINNGFTLLLPAVVLVPFVIRGGVPTTIVVVAIAGVVISVIGIVAIGLIARSETVARSLGSKAGQFMTWFRGLRKRPPPEDMGDAAVHFRDTAIEALRTSWKRIVPLMAGKYVINAAILYVALRSVGLGAGVLSFYEIFAVLVVTGLLTMIEVTPGGLGVTETVYIKLLVLVTGTAHEDQVIAGVLLYRGITYLGPMLLGVGSYFAWRSKKEWRVDSASTGPSLATAGFEPELMTEH